MRRIRQLSWLEILVGASFAVLLATIFMPSPAAAQYADDPCGGPAMYGRPMCRSFFNNTYQEWPDWDMVDGGVEADNIDEFVNIERGYLFGSDRHENIGAAVTILVMMGRNANEFTNNANGGIATARTIFPQWEQRVRDYDAAGLVDYDLYYAFTSDYVNSSQIDTIDAISHMYSPESIWVIRFRLPSGVSGQPFIIQKFCNNLVGTAQMLPPLSPPSGTVNPPTPSTATPPAPPGFNTGDPNVNSSCEFISGRASVPSAPGIAVPIRITYSSGGESNVTTNPSTGRFQAATPASVRNSISPVVVTVTGRDPSGNVFTLSGSPMTIGQCVMTNPQCGSMTVDPDSLDPGSAHRVNVAVNYGTAAEAGLVRAQPGFRFYVRITGPGVNYDNTAVGGPGGGTLSVTGTNLTAAVDRPATGTVGTYIVSWGVVGTVGAADCGGNGTVTGPQGNTNAARTYTVANKPYFVVRGGDALAGPGWRLAGNADAAVCDLPADPQGGIVGWNRGAAGNYAGANGQYAGLAIGRIQDFATGIGLGGIGSQAPAGLSFTNAAGETDPNNGLYGGRLGAADCDNDYFEGVPAGSIQTGDFEITGQTIPDCDGTNDAQCRRTIYIRGNAYISGNITFDGNYASMAAVPSFKLVVMGNIYIAAGVSRLDGAYVAEPATASSGDGVIYTCARAPFAEYSLNDGAMSDACDLPLTVNGAFNARQVWLLRTAGTVSNATVSETFNYIPEVWATEVNNSGDYTDWDAAYESLTNLPPTL